MDTEKDVSGTAEEVRPPVPCWWPEAITEQQYAALAPEKLELVSGYLLGDAEDPEAHQARLDLLALLLTNVGLDEAVVLADAFHWREALDRMGMGW